MRASVLLTATFSTAVYLSAVFVRDARAADPVALWSFYTASWVTVVEPIADLSQPSNGGQDLLVGSADDTLYLVEGHGAKAGGELWRFPMKSTAAAIEAVGDVDGDNRPDVLAGDIANIVYCLSGGTGKAFWAYMTKGSILSLATIPDINGDGIPEMIAGSEDDIVYCFSGAVEGMKDATKLGDMLWKFETGHPGPSPVRRWTGPSGPPESRPQGANSLAVVSNCVSKQVVGIAIGASSDMVFCISTTGQNGKPAVLWKFATPGDAWDVDACGDVDGDNVQDILVACGADISYLLSGKTGRMLWSCKAFWGAQVALAAGDVNGDGKEDGIIGDGCGSVRCISGASQGQNVAPLWTFTTGDSSTITSLATPGDFDGNGKPECIAGSTNNHVYLLTDAGRVLWSADTKGTVYSVAALAGVPAAGATAFVAGSESSIATVYGEKQATVAVHHGVSAGGRFEPRFRSFLSSKIRGGCGFGAPFTITDLLGRTIVPAAGGNENLSMEWDRGGLRSGRYVISPKTGAEARAE